MMRWLGVMLVGTTLLCACKSKGVCGRYEYYEPEDRCICPGTSAMPVMPTDDGLCPEDFDAEMPDASFDVGVDGGFDASVDAFDGGCPDTVWYRDMDGDGYGVEDDTVMGGCFVEGYAERAGDCNDDCRMCNPERDEICDELDNDCDEDVDEELPNIACFRDEDEDGFGRLDVTMMACGCPAGWVENVVVEDCHDQVAEAFPGQTAWFETPYCTGMDGTVCIDLTRMGIPLHETGHTWDYDCDGRNNHRYEEATGCQLSGGSCFRTPVLAGGPPTCGMEIDRFVRCDPSCTEVSEPVTQECH